MKFSVGYQPRGGRDFLDAILAHRERIAEVYFPWGNLPNGRGTLTGGPGEQPFETRQVLADALAEFSAAGIGLNLLLNGNCYGRRSQSRAFFQEIGDAADWIRCRFGLASVTTTSPLIAKFLRTNFPEVEVRASVNMEIGTTQGMEYLADWFDGFYLKREFNRNFTRIGELRRWCDENGKKLYCLANSGCLNFCSAHNFHDNLVAHEQEIAEMDNAYEFRGVCFDYLSKPEKRKNFLRDTNFIRPEDLPLYEPYFDGVKLATRTNRNPAAVLEAYLGGRFSGNLPELLEPNHAERFYPAVIENSRLPADFGETVLHCPKNCVTCGYCAAALETSLVQLPTIGDEI